MGGGDLHDPSSTITGNTSTATITRNDSDGVSDETDSDESESSDNSDDYSCSSSDSDITKLNEMNIVEIDDDVKDQCVL